MCNIIRMITKKKCSSCKYYFKWRNDNSKNSGICEFEDARTDSGNICKNWKGVKYKRSKLNKELKNEIHIT